MGKSAKLLVFILSLSAALLATGCTNKVEATPVSNACKEAFSSLEEQSNVMYAAEAQGKTFTENDWNTILTVPLRSCSSANEWLAAGKNNPEALGFTHPDAIDESMLGVYCYGENVVDAPVCVDAAKEGIKAP